MNYGEFIPENSNVTCPFMLRHHVGSTSRLERWLASLQRRSDRCHKLSRSNAVMLTGPFTSPLCGQVRVESFETSMAYRLIGKSGKLVFHDHS
jgi:hypothetical protein